MDLKSFLQIRLLLFCYNKFCIEIPNLVIGLNKYRQFCYNKFCIEIMDRKPLCKYPFQFCYNKFCIEICICRIIQNVRCKFCYNKFCIEIQKTLISILKGVYFAITNFVLKSIIYIYFARLIKFCYNKFCIEIRNLKIPALFLYPHFAITNFVLKSGFVADISFFILILL